MVTKQVRCESCFKKFDPDELLRWEGLEVCKPCKNFHLKRTEKVPKTPTGKKIERIKPKRHRNKSWFAIQVIGKDTKVKQAITKRLRIKGLSRHVGKFIIPKQREPRVTKNTYEVLDYDGQTVGFVAAHESDEALYLARGKFGKRKGGRGVYHPVNEVLIYDHLEVRREVRAGRMRNVYYALTADERVIATITARTPKRAKEIAERLYGEQAPKPQTNPRYMPQTGIDVKEVREFKKGGKQIIRNKRAMPGYMIVLMDDNPIVFEEIKKVYGVTAVLPYHDKVPVEELRQMHEEGVAAPHPQAIEEKELATIVEPPKPKYEPDVMYKSGDMVRVVNGPYAGNKSNVMSVQGDKLCIEVPIMRIPTKVTVDQSFVRLLDS